MMNEPIKMEVSQQQLEKERKEKEAEQNSLEKKVSGMYILETFAHKTTKTHLLLQVNMIVNSMLYAYLIKKILTLKT